MAPLAGRRVLFSLFLAVLIPTIFSQVDDNSYEKEQKRNATVEALKQIMPQKVNLSDQTLLSARESTFSATYLPVFMIVLALVIIIGMYVYDVAGDITEEGGVYQWTNDTISAHCSDTSTNQFRFLLAACVFLTIGLIILLAREWSYRHDTITHTIWWLCDLVAAIAFTFIGLLPTHQDTTRHKFGRSERNRIPDPETGCLRCSTIKIYRTVVKNDMLKLFCWKTRISRTVSKWIHMIAALYCMIELTVSVMLYGWYFMPPNDEHVLLFRILSASTLGALCTLFFIQGILVKRNSMGLKIRAFLYLASMGSELCTLLLAVIVSMIAILHRDHTVLWVFSTTVGIKT